jgi:hypothetical protein
MKAVVVWGQTFRFSMVKIIHIFVATDTMEYLLKKNSNIYKSNLSAKESIQ